MRRVQAVFGAMRETSARRTAFRVIHFSLQSNHLHLLVEADDRTTLSRGMQSLTIRLARAVNASLARRGRLWNDRYHARALRTPREMRNAIVYVLANWKKHNVTPNGWVDGYSSAAMFDAWHEKDHLLDLLEDRQPWLAAPTTWLARRGFLRAGRVSVRDVPRQP